MLSIDELSQYSGVLSWANAQYWLVEPMLSIDELSKYLSDWYWASCVNAAISYLLLQWIRYPGYISQWAIISRVNAWTIDFEDAMWIQTSQHAGLHKTCNFFFNTFFNTFRSWEHGYWVPTDPVDLKVKRYTQGLESLGPLAGILGR
jgi:hypothetical protein